MAKGASGGCLYMYTVSAVAALKESANVCVCWQGFEVVKGNFSRTFLRVGYHKIAEIPAGACNISIQETVKSRNYLGTHRHKSTHVLYMYMHIQRRH